MMMTGDGGRGRLIRQMSSLRTQCRHNEAAAQFIMRHAASEQNRKIGELAAAQAAEMGQALDAMLVEIAAQPVQEDDNE